MLSDPVVSSFIQLLDANTEVANEAYANFYFALINAAAADNLTDYVARITLTDENVFTLHAASGKTLSENLKKATERGSYKYAIQSSLDTKTNAKYSSIMRETITSIKTAGNIVVIKTYNGMANAAAAAIDAVAGSIVVGTIAGDDTIFAATENEDAAKSFAAVVKNVARKE